MGVFPFRFGWFLLFDFYVALFAFFLLAFCFVFFFKTMSKSRELNTVCVCVFLPFFCAFSTCSRDGRGSCMFYVCGVRGDTAVSLTMNLMKPMVDLDIRALILALLRDSATSSSSLTLTLDSLLSATLEDSKRPAPEQQRRA